jgi:hypothetical protein
MKARYEIKDANGETIYTTGDANTALACYNTVRDAKGYAEIWYGGDRIFKAK